MYTNSLAKDHFFYYVNGKKVIRSFQGQILSDPKNEILLLSDHNILEHHKNNNRGYFVSRFLDNTQFINLRKSVYDYIGKVFEINLSSDNVDDMFQKMEDTFFYKRVRKLYNTGIGFDELPFKVTDLEHWVSNNLGKNLQLQHINHVPALLIRIIRPAANDFNPPHRDVYISHLRNAINSFMPIYGVNNDSSLSLIEESHFWNENSIIRTLLNPIIDKKKFSVPAILSKASKEPLNLIRPIVDYGEIMIFSPYLIHGGAINLSKHTRISLEFRFL
ncbi:hypothetical protein [Prochlorococcus marinus]|uniref:hypothetical protein n=1 Tax=Prochlorococcus marinus TaxID=1219 RepID=UPI0022B53276|nr:hypothetical protein [Prochlorococcus marinus]